MLQVHGQALDIHEKAVNLPAEKPCYRLRLSRCEEASVYVSNFLVGPIARTRRRFYGNRFCREAPSRTEHSDQSAEGPA